MTDRTQSPLMYMSFPGEKVARMACALYPQHIHLLVLLQLLPVGIFPAVQTPMPSLGVTCGHGERFMWYTRP